MRSQSGAQLDADEKQPAPEPSRLIPVKKMPLTPAIRPMA